VMPGLAAGDAAAVAERIRAEVAHAPFTLPLRVSIGLASWPADARDRDSLLARADDALYAAKRAGKDRVVPAVVVGETQSRAASGGGRTNLLDLLRAKDPATVSHCARVAALAVEVGQRLGVGGDRLADLRTAGGLHDVGKVAVPDAILNKPGLLDEAEMQIVRAHSVVGAELMRAAGMADVARFVLEHHERIDGGGYPQGLAGEEISLEGRILHAVDAYAAMTSDRPYRSAMDRSTAIDELRRGSGTQFDADVVHVLEDLLREDPEDAPDWTVDTVANASQPAQPQPRHA